MRQLIIVGMLALLAGCSATEQQQRTGTGAVIGGASGALLGQAIGRDTKSTVIGAAAGTVIGAAVGSASTPAGSRDDDLCRYRDRYGRTYTAPCDNQY